MADAKCLRLRKQRALALGIQIFHATAATGRDDAPPLRVGLQQLRHEPAASLGEMAQHTHLVVESRGRIGTVIHLDHSAIECQMDGGAKRVLYFQHALNVLCC